MSAVEIVDSGNSMFGAIGERIQCVAWGPAADGTGEWFVRRAGETQAIRVADKDAAIEALRGAR